MDASKEDIPYREEISSISESLPCRESQIKLLLSLFGEVYYRVCHRNINISSMMLHNSRINFWDGRRGQYCTLPMYNTNVTMLMSMKFLPICRSTAVDPEV